MQVDLYYDPVRPETAVLIDGKRTDRGDIFGFLYPVRNCILQTWLPESGSWNGLIQQLSELARGEKVRVIFHGREADYRDIHAMLSETDWIEIDHVSWDPIGAQTEMFQKAKQLLDHIMSVKVLMDENNDVRNEKTIRDLFPEVTADIDAVRTGCGKDEWFVSIRTEEDFTKAVRSYGNCCVVSDAFLRSYEQFAKLEKLFRSMRRSQDMIFCCFDTAEKREEYRQYNAQYLKYAVSFGMEGDSASLRALQSKYGDVCTKREELNRIERCRELLSGCFSQKAQLDKCIQELEKDSSKEAIRKKLLYRHKRRWLVHEQKRFDEMTAVLHGDISERQLESETQNQ